MKNRATIALATATIAASMALGAMAPATAAVTQVTSIEKVQGTGTASEMVGQQVTVRAVVTGAYSEGGFRGFYIQTAGSGSEISPEGSSGIFVYSPSGVDKVAVGDHVQVSGTVSEYFGLTQLSASGSGIELLTEPAAAIKPLALEIPSSDNERERFESMLIDPQGQWTVADNYSLNQYGEITLAHGTSEILPGERTLRQATDAFAPGSTEAVALEAENQERALLLDDGATVNFLGSNTNKSIPLPYLSADHHVSVGAAATFTGPVIMDYRYDQWRVQPQGQVVGAEDADIPAAFAQVKDAGPEAVGGNISVGSFNVLNYFTTTGDQLNGCSYYTDREGQPVTVRSGCDARGAANSENLARQQAKIVSALNKFDADVVVLEEIENSARFGLDRDDALATLVDALNQAAGTQQWKYVPSPSSVPADEDVIRTAMIYKADAVKTIGKSTILEDPAFYNAREPLAQAFQRVGGNSKTRFLAVANHFKSKGSDPQDGSDNADKGDGAGAWNAARVDQAEALVRFAQGLKKKHNTNKVLLAGDFNSYSAEEPIQVLARAGYVDLGADAKTRSYLFAGRTGSLDHIFGSREVAQHVTGQTIWNINATESVAYEYSRFNYNVAQLFAPDQFRSSDHDPVLVGLQLNKK
ncbi:ExeM/NucH family extracellular endonuclease [Paeniglutamicibacter gangotriensis]|uniref:Endonuclease/exonuclease/phosphatase family protein n=1 Tax=Paeniglutamicibacter gangotriensis Lz1y TaxID=1276920 RepID=M7NFY2_9MICC|nr:ExeM/NucH family extracellular endonuclease [Paeniglutamicibacter gangotriensis]EMQ97418.1 endonuclease/exonuclease/phosphatase family protein [Paeniglutamicibacter gangotriensis Lz1y]